MSHDNLLERFIAQLDTLIPFLAISHREVFELMERERYIWIPQNQQDSFPNTYDIFSVQITHSGFLLGYSYFEVFLTSLIKDIYRINPKMLPKDKQLKFGEIAEINTFDGLVELMIEKEAVALFYQSMENIIKYFEEKLHLKWTDEEKARVVQGSLIRNCLLHNMSLADSRLAQVSNYKIGEEIKLYADDVHFFGIVARALARSLYKQATERYFDNTTM